MKIKNEISKLFSLFALGFGAIIGVGWSVTLSNFFMMGGGPIPAALGFIAVVVLLIPITLCFAELTPAMPVAGGVIAYSYKAYGKLMAFVSGWFVIMAYVSILPWEAIAVNDIIAYIFPGLKSGIAIYTVAGSEIFLPSLVSGIVLSLIIVAINWRGINVAAKVQSWLAIILIACSLLCVVFLIGKFSPENLLPVYSQIEGKPHTSIFAGVFAIIAMGPFYFAGFDTIPQAVEETGAGIRPNKLGSIIVITMLGAGLFYVLILLSVGASFSWFGTVALERPVLSVLLQTLYPGVLGKALFWISLIGTLAGLFSTWNGFYIAGAQLLVGMSRAGLLPKIFMLKHKHYGTPVTANLFCAAIMVIGPFIGVGVIDYLTLLGSTGFIIGWFIVCICAYRLRKKAPEMERPYRVPGGQAVMLIASIVSFLMILNTVIPGMPGYMGFGGICVMVVWIILGIGLYLYIIKHDKMTEEERLSIIFEKSKPD